MAGSSRIDTGLTGSLGGGVWSAVSRCVGWLMVSEAVPKVIGVIADIWMRSVTQFAFYLNFVLSSSLG